MAEAENRQHRDAGASIDATRTKVSGTESSRPGQGERRDASSRTKPASCAADCFSTSGSDSAVATRGVLWALGYAVSSICLMLFNKSVLSSYDFHYPLTLTVAQSLVTLVCLMVLKHSGMVSIPDFNWSVALQIAPLSALFIFYVVASLAALGNVNVPMYTALSRTTVVFIMVEEYIIDGKIQSKLVLAATTVMVMGAVVAASKDLTFDPWAYTLVLLTIIGNSLYNVNIPRVKKSSGLTILGVLFYNNVLTLPGLIVVTWATGEFQDVQKFPYLFTPGFQMVFAGSAFLALGMNMCVYYSNTLNGPTTQSVVGQLKNFVLFLLSLFLFSDYIFDPTNFCGLLIGFSGGVWYAYIKYDERISQEEAKQSQELAAVEMNDKEKGLSSSPRGGGSSDTEEHHTGDGRESGARAPADSLMQDLPTHQHQWGSSVVPR